MADEIKPIEGVASEILEKQSYKGSEIAQNMFTSCERNKSRKVMIAPTKLTGVTIAKLWEGVFTGSSDFLQKYHDRRKERNLQIGQWEIAGDKSNGYRYLSMETVVEVPRAGTYTQLCEAHRFAYTKKDDGTLLLTYQISSQTPQVPAGSSFRPEALIEVTAPSEDEDCTFSVQGNCKKMGMAFVGIQYIAVPRAIKDMTAAYKVMLEMISEKLMKGEKLSVATGDTEKDAGDSGAGASTDGGSSGEGEGEGTNIIFQAVVLVLAVVIALSLLWVIPTIRAISNQGSYMTALSRHDLCRTCGNMGMGGSANADATANAGEDRLLQSITQSEALRSAARESQMQSLRYRWMEQRAMLASLENSVAWLWWIVIALSLTTAGLLGKIVIG